jgi:DNA helicase-2/ATP-dependent DNA helicase PcrA
MKPTTAQDFEPGDLAALSFANPEEEAAWIAQTCKSLGGVAVKEDEKHRGISWSDMAVLLRSVRKNGEPITRALDTAGIPYVVVGMNNLFETREAEAARQLFYFMDGQTDEAALLATWEQARTGAKKAALKAAIAKAAQSRTDMAKGDKPFGFYSIQRQFLAFLEDAEVREETVPDGRGEVLFYNLGKFSQLISDFETIHYHSAPLEKYKSFAGFLENGAEDAYPEGWQDNQYANPDAVRIMTVHQAKGMQWPVVFIPALLKNRFPSKAQGGRSVWHLIPEAAVKGHDRYRGTIEDERRLFYVAMTRSQKFVFFTWAPVRGNQLYQKVSQFWENVLASKYIKRKAQDYSKRKRLAPTPRAGIANVVLSFSDLKYFFECPYQFKLRILYGFNAPIHEALGYGKSLHDALAEVHMRAIDKDYATDKEIPDLLERHLHAPYAYPALRENLEKAAEKVLRNYLADNRKEFDKIEYSEKGIEINLGDGVTVKGRIDLVRRLDTNETYIVDLKSNDRVQAEEVTETQLHIYALGYQELTGKRADYVETYALEERKRTPRSVDDDFIKDVKDKVRGAAQALRTGAMPVAPSAKKCGDCDYRRMCTAGRAAAGTK